VVIVIIVTPATTLCNLVEVYRSLRGFSWLIHQATGGQRAGSGALGTVVVLQLQSVTPPVV
jgi:hypothetical protein